MLHNRYILHVILQHEKDSKREDPGFVSSWDHLPLWYSCPLTQKELWWCLYTTTVISRLILGGEASLSMTLSCSGPPLHLLHRQDTDQSNTKTCQEWVPLLIRCHSGPRLSSPLETNDAAQNHVQSDCRLEPLKVVITLGTICTSLSCCFLISFI